jgi:hypothetical protein
MMFEIKLIGGPCNGKSVRVNSFQPCVYLPRPCTIEQIELLKTDDDRIVWKFPEAVYKKVSKDVFVYQHTVHYKPREGGQIEIEGDLIEVVE